MTTDIAKWCRPSASIMGPSKAPEPEPVAACGCSTSTGKRKLPPGSTILVLLALGFAGGIWMAR